MCAFVTNFLFQTPLGGIHASETRQKFLEGSLHPTNLLMCPHTCVTNLPKPREVQSDVGPAAVFVGNIVQGARIAGARGRDLGSAEDDKVSDETKSSFFLISFENFLAALLSRRLANASRSESRSFVVYFSEFQSIVSRLVYFSMCCSYRLVSNRVPKW